MSLSLISKIVCLGVAVSAACLAPASAQTVEEFYKGKQVTLVVGAAASGGADFYARQFVPFLQKHIPGNPNIIVNNLPGASGMTAAIHLQHSAPKDGTSIAMLQRNNLYLPLVSDIPIDFDPREVAWLGSLNKEIYTVSVMKRSKAQKAEDLFTTPVKMGATSFANENRVIPAMMNEYYGTKFEIVTGYEGAAAMTLALERGEIDGRMLPVDNLTGYGNEAPWLKDGTIQVLLQTAIVPSPLFPDVPKILDFTKDAEVTALTEFVLLPMEAGRPFAAPPGLPEDRLAALRKAFVDAAHDPEYIAAMEKVANAPTPISGEEAQALVAKLYATPEPVLAKARKLVNPPK